MSVVDRLLELHGEPEMQPSDDLNMECGHGDPPIVPDMEHPVESMPKLQRTEKRVILSKEETRSQFESVERVNMAQADPSESTGRDTGTDPAEAYRTLYETAKPFPSMNKCGVNRIFDEGAIYYLVQEGDSIHKLDVQESLESYNDIMSSPKTESKRKIIEAVPGYGKSTLLLQCVYDVCTENPESPLKDVKLLILLQLRHLIGVKSIYTAIKHAIVPKDEDMDESCIKEILKAYKKSTAMLFDSYNEYPDKKTKTDISSIIEMKMFPDILVIIPTRTFYLPPNLHPETKRIRLTGFGEAERRNYVLKAVADDVQLVDRIEKELQRNPFLRDLCQVPLFSTMVAHIAHERPEIEIFSTVTRFFTYVIACVHNHMKIKKDANTGVPAFETELAKLYRIAFDDLTQKNQQLTWENTYLVSELGQEFYDNYIMLGMLAQEVVFDISQCRYKTFALIWHKIICEFYASHHLVWILSEGASSAASSINVKETLNSITPLDLQYVYRFVCGLHKSAADIIIKHLQETKEGRQFAILCMLEQEEKSDQFMQSVEDLVSSTMAIYSFEANLLKRSTIQFLEVASAKQHGRSSFLEGTLRISFLDRMIEKLWKSTKQLEEKLKRPEQNRKQPEENRKQPEQNRKQPEENRKQLEEATWQLEESTRQEGRRRLVQPHQELIAPKYKPRPQLTIYRIISRAFIMMLLAGLCCGATGNTDCLTTQSVLLGSQGIIRCRLFESSTRFYWFDTNIEGGDTALIILENGRVRGTGYTSGEFNIDSDGSLIINSVTVQHERVFHLESVSPNLITSTKDITVIVYVEPIEQIPVITECMGKYDCIMKGNLDGVISCVHHNTRPAATISWFMRYGTHDIPLNSTTSQTLSADLITFSVTSEMAIGEIPLLVNMQSLVLLLCKSHNPYSVVQESDSKVLLDISQNDPFEKQPDLPEDPVYAIQNQDLVLECPLTIAVEDSIVLWMAKSLETRNNGYLIYSSYGVVPSMETDEQVSLDKSSDLVISQVGLQHEGQYACVQSTVNNTKSFLQRVEVIVQPTPSKVLVEGCKLFQPCSFHITETKTITCKVNGVHPKVELMIKALSTNLAVIKTEVSNYEDEGLFYTSIRGDVIVVDASCQENGTIICQAVGPAANIFKSDVYVTISSQGKNCPQISAAPFPTDKAVQTSPATIIYLAIVVAFLLCIVLIIVLIKMHLSQRKIHRHMLAVPVEIYSI